MNRTLASVPLLLPATLRALGVRARAGRQGLPPVMERGVSLQ